MRYLSSQATKENILESHHQLIFFLLSNATGLKGCAEAYETRGVVTSSTTTYKEVSFVNNNNNNNKQSKNRIKL